MTILGVVMMNALFLIGLTYRVMTKRFAVAWDTGTMAAVYVSAMVLCLRAEGIGRPRTLHSALRTVAGSIRVERRAGR